MLKSYYKNNTQYYLSADVSLFFDIIENGIIIVNSNFFLNNIILGGESIQRRKKIIQ